MIPHLVIATRNAHKVDEIQAVLGPRFVYHTLRDFPGAPEIAETGDTFEANARLKAEGLALWLAQGGAMAARGATSPRPEPSAPPHVPGESWFVLADDSGLEVDALGGAPGVQSARFAAQEFGIEGNAPDGANNARLLRLLADVPAASRTARFRCVLAYTPVGRRDSTRFFAGACEGRIAFVPRGAHGFGYDPLFVPHGFSESLAELGETTKNRISHRSHALQAFQAQLPA